MLNNEKLFCHSIYCISKDEIYAVVDARQCKNNLIITLVNDNGRERDVTNYELLEDFTFMNKKLGLEVEDEEKF